MHFRIISIGALSTHELWDKKMQPRTAHATTTLVRSGDRVILVDPGLPSPVIHARLGERAGLDAQDVTDVFLTNFRPAHRRGLDGFPHARWLISEAEREAVGMMLVEHLHEQSGDAQVCQMLEGDIALLKKCRAAPDQLAKHVDLFPLPGFTPGTCGLLLSEPRRTIMIVSDAIATEEHLQQGRVLRGAYDVHQAQESFTEAVEIADVIVPGHDNVVLNPVRSR
jgi:glyoxylase-like metal-dependent hydrolase (beta-lactamase superfamily II)